MDTTTTRVKKRRRVPRAEKKKPGRKYEDLVTVMTIKVTPVIMRRLKRKGNVSRFIREAILVALEPKYRRKPKDDNKEQK